MVLKTLKQRLFKEPSNAGRLAVRLASDDFFDKKTLGGAAVVEPRGPGETAVVEPRGIGGIAVVEPQGLGETVVVVEPKELRCCY